MASLQMTHRPQPPAIVQQSWASCWAAALSSWLLAVNSPKAETQKDLIKKYGEDDTSIKIPAFQKLADKFGMMTSLITDSKPFVPQNILERIKNSSVLIIGFLVDDPGEKHPFWHDVVLWGVVPGGQGEGKEKEGSYAIMDPGASPSQYLRVPRGWFFTKGDDQEWLIGWSKTPTRSPVTVDDVKETKPETKT